MATNDPFLFTHDDSNQDNTISNLHLSGTFNVSQKNMSTPRTSKLVSRRRLSDMDSDMENQDPNQQVGLTKVFLF